MTVRSILVLILWLIARLATKLPDFTVLYDVVGFSLILQYVWALVFTALPPYKLKDPD